MKIKNAKFIFVQLDQRLNKTVSEFQKFYGKNMITRQLNNMDDIEVEVTKTVIATIENDYVFSNRI